MKRIYLRNLFTLVLSIFFTGMIHADDFPRLLLDFEEVELETGETFQLPGMLDYVENAESGTVEVEVQWTVDPASLGSINESFLFTAENAGEGNLFVSYDTLTLSVELKIEAEEEDNDEEDDEDDAPKVKIVPDKVKVELGDSLELYAFYVAPDEGKKDTIFTWSVEPAELGTFPDAEVPVFQTNNIGEGIIIATLDELADTIKVKIYEGKWQDKDDDDHPAHGGKKITITPGDTTVMADAGMIQYKADYKTENQQDDDSETTWSVSDTDIATIDEDGLLSLTGETGLILVTAKIENHEASVELLVIDPSADPDVNTITIHRVLPNGKVLHPKTFNEGESYVIGGLPYPLNVLNSGKLHFPFGCISENITIFMKIPEDIATTDDDDTEVIFSEGIITGVEFNVQPEGSEEIVHPYEFITPLELKLPFKRGLLESLGIEPYDLDVFFAENALFVPVEEGVATVDSSANTIYASIEHFSTIVVRKSAEATTSVDELNMLSEGMLSIYPNPFNKATTFQFYLTEPAEVKIEIYSMSGQTVQILADKKFEKGSHRIQWDGKNRNGGNVPAGVYFGRFIQDGKTNDTKKLIINR